MTWPWMAKAHRFMCGAKVGPCIHSVSQFVVFWGYIATDQSGYHC